jgi:RNA polymerase sigma-70 factor (ECF subfamily)
MNDARSDEQLLAATPREPEAFAVLYRRYEIPILHYFLRRGSEPEVAADLTAETFAAALAGASRFRAGPQPLQAWLYGIARNVLRESVRRRRVEDRHRRALEMSPLTLGDESIERIDRLGSGGVAAMLESLSPAQREAIDARVLREEPYAEIASQLGCSESVVRQRVSRGIRRLRTKLKETP